MRPYRSLAALHDFGRLLGIAWAWSTHPPRLYPWSHWRRAGVLLDWADAGFLTTTPTGEVVIEVNTAAGLCRFPVPGRAVRLLRRALGVRDGRNRVELTPEGRRLWCIWQASRTRTRMYWGTR